MTRYSSAKREVLGCEYMVIENKHLLWAIIGMGILGIFALIATREPRYGYQNGNPFAASATLFDTHTTNAYNNAPGHYSILRTYPKETQTTTYTYTTAPYTYYTVQPSYADEFMFSDGCTMTSPYSLTTGEPCS